jgi:hypothetical protein
MITKILEQLLKNIVRKIVLFSMVAILLSGSIYYFFNFQEPSRPHVAITPKEFKTGKINDELSATDEVEIAAKFEEYNAKHKVFKAKLSKAEWKLLEYKLTLADYKKKVADSRSYCDNLSIIKHLDGDISSYLQIPYPSETEVFTYSMTRFMDHVYAGLDIDSTGFDICSKKIY